MSHISFFLFFFFLWGTLGFISVDSVSVAPTSYDEFAIADVQIQNVIPYSNLKIINDSVLFDGFVQSIKTYEHTDIQTHLLYNKTGEFVVRFSNGETINATFEKKQVVLHNELISPTVIFIADRDVALLLVCLGTTGMVIYYQKIK